MLVIKYLFHNGLWYFYANKYNNDILVILCKSILHIHIKTTRRKIEKDEKSTTYRSSQLDIIADNWRLKFFYFKSIFDKILWRRSRNKWYWSLQSWDRCRTWIFEQWLLPWSRAVLFRPKQHGWPRQMVIIKCDGFWNKGNF